MEDQTFRQGRVRVTYCACGYVIIETMEDDTSDVATDQMPLWLTRDEYDTMRRIFEQSGKVGA